MLLVSAYFAFPLNVLLTFVAVDGYTYQTKPLYLSYSDLAALEAAGHVGDPFISAAADEDRGETVTVKCLEDSIEVVVKAHFLHGGPPTEPVRLRLGLDSGAEDRCAAKLSLNGDYVIRAPLVECGNRVMVGETSSP